MLKSRIAAFVLLLTGLLASAAQAAGHAPPKGLSGQQQIMHDVRALVDLGPRRSGTPGGDRAARYVARGLREAGVPQVWEEHATTYQWKATRWGLQLAGRPVDAFPATQSFFGAERGDWTGSFSTEAGGRRAEVVDIGNGTAFDLLGKDLRGKVVLFNLRFLAPLLALGAVSEWIYDPAWSLVREPRTLLQANPYLTNYVDVVREAQRRGAVGFIGVLSDYFDSNRYRNEYYRRLNVTIPGFWVTNQQARELRATLRADRHAQATLHLAGRRWAAQTRTVVGLLPGQNPEEALMVQSHHDSLGPGAVEDASGTASLLAQARYFASLPRARRPRSLLFTSFDSHFTGYQAHQAFAAKYFAPHAPLKIVGNATIEHIARQGLVQHGQLVMRNAEEPRAFFRTGGTEVRRALIETIRKYDLRRTTLINARALSRDGNIPTDAAFAAMSGVPTVSYISGPIYLYDDIDTIDKVDQRQLVPVNAAFAELIARLSALPQWQLQGR